jgi:3-dehydroquinate dehydratase
MYTLFDSFFAPTRVVVVSEERLKAAELKLKQEQIEVIDNRIDELAKYRIEIQEQLKVLQEPQSLEEALTGDA